MPISRAFYDPLTLKWEIKFTYENQEECQVGVGENYEKKELSSEFSLKINLIFKRLWSNCELDFLMGNLNYLNY